MTESEEVGLVLGAPDEPIRRQRQIVGYLREFDARQAGIYKLAETTEKNIEDIHKLAQSCRMALWAIAVVLLVHVIRHW